VKISFRMQIMIWFSGLRGAIAFALALNLKTPGGSVLITTTLFIVLFTTLGLGCLTSPLIKKLKLQHIVTEAEMEVRASLITDIEPEYDANKDYDDEGNDVVLHTKRISTSKPDSWFHRHWRIFDEKIMKKWFGGKPRPGYFIH